jgi:hypothetical protein
MTNNNPTHLYQKIVKPTQQQYNKTILKEIMCNNTSMNLTAANLYETI